MNNTIKSLFVIASAAVILAGCQRTALSDKGPHKYSFVLDEGTRAVIGENSVEWVAGDEVGLSVGNYTGSAEVDVTTSPKKVVLYSDSDIPAGTMAYAWFPFDAENVGEAPKKVNITLSNTQSGSQVSAMPLAGVPFEVKEAIAANAQEGNGTIRFLNLGSLLIFKVFSSDKAFQGETVKSIRLDASAPIAGSGYFDLTAVSEGDEESLILTVDSGSKDAPLTSVRVDEKVPVAVSKEEAKPVKMVVLPGTFKGTLTVITDAAEYTKEIPEYTFARSHSRTFNLDLAQAKRTEDTSVATLKVDELTIEWLKVNPALIGATYKEWSDMPGTASKAVYAGYTASGNSSIQLNDDNKAGIVSTTSGGLVRKISVVWNGSTANARSLAIYVSHTPYKSAADLFSTSTQGTLLGYLSMGWPSTEFTIEDDWEYIGLRSYDKTLYITELNIGWEE